MTLKVKPKKLPKKIKYWAIQIWNEVEGEVHTYEVFRSKKIAKRWLKADYKNTHAVIAKIKLKFKD